MSQIETAYSRFECDTPGCPSEFSITRHRLETEIEVGGDELSDDEMLMWAGKLGWRVVDGKAFCTDCIREARI